ncbi:hypothetical protein CYMTET_21944 [Cymbomonas tetramitiformis]|uniref:Uncharacterized protein n=1 Tax=Cymbomonas tetramitiformis TaxID=36881 RepID=A0AAE0G165_9CHLO|nr:hypothetical protein CYMTET_21944 [Cymbomonas tetramitiformis]
MSENVSPVTEADSKLPPHDGTKSKWTMKKCTGPPHEIPERTWKRVDANRGKRLIDLPGFANHPMYDRTGIRIYDCDAHVRASLDHSKREEFLRKNEIAKQEFLARSETSTADTSASGIREDSSVSQR